MCDLGFAGKALYSQSSWHGVAAIIQTAPSRVQMWNVMVKGSKQNLGFRV